jgi:TRAP-type C4-dicarboxylate transport system substrate-binding protein
MKITKQQLKQIIKEELEEMMYRGDENQEATEKEMETYLIKKGVYKGDRNGRIEIFTGIVQTAEEALEASGQFEQQAIDIFINRLHRMVS